MLILGTYINMIILKSEKNQILSTVRTIIKGLAVLFYTIFVISLLSGGLSAGILTLTPHEASRPNFLGYYSLCSFVPFSTMILFTMAIVGTLLLIKLVKYYKRALKRVKIGSPKLIPKINY